MNFPFSFWKNVDVVPGVTYVTFTTTAEATGVNCAVGEMDILYSYTSVSAGDGNVEFYAEISSPPVVPGQVITCTACLPNDATNFVILNESSPYAGQSGTHTSVVNTGVNCLY